MVIERVTPEVAVWGQWMYLVWASLPSPIAVSAPDWMTTDSPAVLGWVSVAGACCVGVCSVCVFSGCVCAGCVCAGCVSAGCVCAGLVSGLVAPSSTHLGIQEVGRTRVVPTDTRSGLLSWGFAFHSSRH